MTIKNFAKKSISFKKVALKSHWLISNHLGLSPHSSENSLWWSWIFCFWVANHDSLRLARLWGMRRLPAALAFLNRGNLCIEHHLSTQAAHECSQACTKKLGTKILHSGNRMENTSLFLGHLLEPQEMLGGTFKNKLLSRILDQKFSNLLSAELQY